MAEPPELVGQVEAVLIVLRDKLDKTQEPADYLRAERVFGTAGGSLRYIRLDAQDTLKKRRKDIVLADNSSRGRVARFGERDEIVRLIIGQALFLEQAQRARNGRPRYDQPFRYVLAASDFRLAGEIVNRLEIVLQGGAQPDTLCPGHFCLSI